MATQAERIIAKFGTAARLARLLGHTNSSTVCGWKARGWIPAPQQPEVLAVAWEHGVPLTPGDFFGLGDGSPEAVAAE